MGGEELLPQIDQLTNHGGKLALFILQWLWCTWTVVKGNWKRRRDLNETVQYIISFSWGRFIGLYIKFLISHVSHMLEHGSNTPLIGSLIVLWKSSLTYSFNMIAKPNKHKSTFGVLVMTHDNIWFAMMKQGFYFILIFSDLKYVGTFPFIQTPHSKTTSTNGSTN